MDAANLGKVIEGEEEAVEGIAGKIDRVALAKGMTAFSKADRREDRCEAVVVVAAADSAVRQYTHCSLNLGHTFARRPEISPERISVIRKLHSGAISGDPPKSAQQRLYNSFT